MAAPIIRCGVCGKPIDPLEDWCLHCGAGISVDDVRHLYEAVLDE